MKRQLSANYLTIESATIINAIREQLDKQGVTYNLYHRKGAGSKEMFDIRISSSHLSLGNDVCTPRIIVKNSYFGESALLVTGGFIRHICNNGMVFGSDWFTSRIVHRIGDTAERKLKQLQYDIAAVVDYIAEELPQQIDQLVKTELTEEQMIELAASLNLSQCRKDYLIKAIVYNVRRDADKANNLWTLWNMANETIGRGYKSEVRFFERNVSLIDDILFLYESLYGNEYNTLAA